MAVEYYKASKDVQNKVMELIGKGHPDLSLVADEIVVIFREKAGKRGGQVVLGSAKKVSAMANALAGEDYKFVLEVAADQWEHELTTKQREALLDHLLCACRCDEDPKTGNAKCYIAPPDIMAYRENVERYGMWFPKDEEGDDSDDADVDNAVEDLFQGE